MIHILEPLRPPIDHTPPDCARQDDRGEVDICTAGRPARLDLSGPATGEAATRFAFRGGVSCGQIVWFRFLLKADPLHVCQGPCCVSDKDWASRDPRFGSSTMSLTADVEHQAQEKSDHGLFSVFSWQAKPWTASLRQSRAQTMRRAL